MRTPPRRRLRATTAIATAIAVMVGLLATPVAQATEAFHPGALSAWGSDASGQLGNGSAGGGPSPTAVADIWALDFVDAGGNHSVALSEDGTLYSWGSNSNGQLGIGGGLLESSNQHSPQTVASPQPGSAFTAVAAGGTHTVAVVDGFVYAWGANGNGQSGGATPLDVTTPSQVQFKLDTDDLDPQELFLGDVVAVAAGDTHSLAVDQDGTIWAWGNNDQGQLGGGAVTETFNPIATKVDGAFAPTDGGTQVIAAGGAHSLAINQHDSSQVYTWGRNEEGQLGRGDPTMVARTVDLGGTATAVSAGAAHSVALVDDDVYTWGDNTSGQLGRVTTTPATPGAVGLGAVTSVDAGVAHTAAVTTATNPLGAAKTWGANGSGQLGTGTTLPSSLPVDVVGDLASVAGIAAGGAHTVAVTPPLGSISPTELDFGSIDVGAVSDPKAFEFKNLGPGPVVIEGFDIENEMEFDLLETDCEVTAQLEKDETCTVTLRYEPHGKRNAKGTLTIDTSAVNSLHKATLLGIGTVTPGDLVITAIPDTCDAEGPCAPEVPASPDQFGVGEAVFFNNAPNLPLENAPIGLPNVAPIGLPNVAPIGLPNVAPIGLPNVAPIGLPNVAPLLTDVRIGPIGLPNVAPIGLPNVAPIALPNVAGTPAVRAVLESISLAEFSLFDQQALDCIRAAAGRPDQQISVYEIFTADELSPCVEDLRIADVSWANTPLSNTSAWAWAAGAMPIAALLPASSIPNGGICGFFEAAGYTDCGAELAPVNAGDAKGRATSLLAAELVGINTSELHYSNALVANVRNNMTIIGPDESNGTPVHWARYTLPDGHTYETFAPPVFRVPLAKINHAASDTGALHLGHMTDPPANESFVCDDATNGGADCGSDTDPGDTVAVAAASGHIKPGATFDGIFSADDELMFGTVVLSAMITQDAILSVPLETFMPRTPNVTYEVEFTNQNAGPVPDPTLLIDLDRNVIPTSRGLAQVVINPETDATDAGSFGPSSAVLSDETGRIEITYTLAGATLQAGDTVVLSFEAHGGHRDGLRTAGAHLTAVLAEDGDDPDDLPDAVLEQASRTLTPLRVKPNWEDNDTEADVSSQAPFGCDTVIVQQISHQDDVDRMRVDCDIPAGAEVEVFASHFDGANHLAVYYPSDALLPESLVPGTPREALSVANLDPSVTPDVSGTTPVTLAEVPDAGTRVLAGASTNQSTMNEYARFTMPEVEGTDESIEIVVWPDAAEPATGSYSVIVRYTDPPTLEPCTTTSVDYSGADTVETWNGTLRPGTDTLVLLNASFFAQASPSDYPALRQTLSNLETAFPNVQVVEVDRHPAIKAALDAREDDPGSKAANNAVIQAFNKARINELDPAGTIRFIDVLGGPDAFPSAWEVDPTNYANQRTYLDAFRAHGGDCSLANGLLQGQMFGDGAIGAVESVRLPGARYLYPASGAAVGRLVGTAADIASRYADVIARDATIAFNDAVAAGDDFMNRLADVNADAMDTQGISMLSVLTSRNADSGEPTPYAKADLTNALGRGPDAIAVHLHSDSRAALTPDGSLFTADELETIDTGPDPDDGSLYSTMGCNVGTIIAAAGGDANGWVGAISDRSRIATANMVYGLSMSHFNALSALGQAEFFADLTAPGRLAGKWQDARWEIIVQNGRFDGFAEKAYGGWVFFGSTLWQTAPSAASGETAVEATPDPATGIPAATVQARFDVNDNFERNDTADGTYYEFVPPAGFGGGVRVNAGEPAQPMATVDVTADTPATGAIFEELTVQPAPDGSNTDFVHGAVHLASALDKPEPKHPLLEGTPHDLLSLVNRGGKSQLAITLGRVGEVDPGAKTGTQDLIPGADVEVFYGDGGDSAGFDSLFGQIIAPPPTAPSVALVAEVLGDPALVNFGIPQPADGGGAVVYDFVAAHCVDGRCSAHARLDAYAPDYPSNLEIIAQVVNQDGSSAIRFFDVTTPVHAPGVSVTIGGTPTGNGAFEDPDVTFTFDEAEVAGLDVSVNGEASFEYAGTFDLDGSHQVFVVTYQPADSDTRYRFAVVADNDDADAITITRTLPTRSTFIVGEADSGTLDTRLGFLCTAVSLASCTADITTSSGAPVGGYTRLPGDGSRHIYTGKVGSYTVTITAVDNNGHSAQKSFVYLVTYRFVPIKNIAGINGDPITVKAGSDVPVQFKLTSFDGTPITDTSGISFVSYQTNCETGCSPADEQGGSQIRVDENGTIKFNWATKKAWRGTTRVLVARLPDGTLQIQNVVFT